MYGYEQNQIGIWCGSVCRCRRYAPRSRPESVLTHTVTHTGKRADGNNGTNRLRPHPFWTKNRRKALYSKGWKALRWFGKDEVGGSNPPSSSRKHRKLRFSVLFVVKTLKEVWVKMWVNCLTHTVTHTRKCAERAKEHRRGSSVSSSVFLSFSAFTSPVS